MTIIDGDTLKEAYKNAANIDDREKETAYKMIDQQIEAQKEKFDMLVYDPNGLVRVAVAEQGYGVAKQGFGLDRLIDDPDPTVRVIVAGQGYDLDHLINDPDENVRAAAEQLSKKISMQHSEQKASRPKSKGRSR